LSIANYLTFFRLAISPIFLLIYLMHDFLGISRISLPYVLLVLLTVSQLTDLFDGYITRKYNQVTELGKVLDPMADSITNISVFLTYTMDPVRLPLPLVFIFLYRDSVISTLRTLCAMKGFTLAAQKSGKIKAWFQAISAYIVLFLMIPESLGYISDTTLYIASTFVVSIAAFYSLYTGIEYICKYWHFIIAKKPAQ